MSDRATVFQVVVMAKSLACAVRSPDLYRVSEIPFVAASNAV
jgi:hypothetical protein